MPVIADLEGFINEQVASSPMPGLACAAVVEDEVVWSYGSGWADVERQVPMRSDTIMNVASVSKPVTATALLRLWEETGFDLDANISSLLGFDVRNPHHQDAPMTTRQLLAHRSSIMDGPAYEAGYVCGCPSEDLETWLKAYLVPGGQYYSATENFHMWSPGTEAPPEAPRAYSNVGYGLISLLLEKVSGTSFAAYCANRIFCPLGMHATSWFLDDIPPERHASLYSLVPDNPDELGFGGVEVVREQLPLARTAEPGSLFKHCLYSHPIKADGMLRTSVDELARFVGLYTNGGAFQGEQILRRSTLEMMLSTNHFGHALCWKGGKLDDGRVRWHHGGSDPGVGTLLLFEPAQQLGILLFSNFAGPAPFLSEIYLRIKAAFT